MILRLLVGGAPRAKQAGKFGLCKKAVESDEKVLSIRSQKQEGTVISGMSCGTECLRGSVTFSLLQVLLPAASLLQLMDVRQNCCDFLQSQLHPTNCLGIRAFADVHTCTDLLQQANAYAGKAGRPTFPVSSWS